MSIRGPKLLAFSCLSQFNSLYYSYGKHLFRQEDPSQLYSEKDDQVNFIGNETPKADNLALKGLIGIS